MKIINPLKSFKIFNLIRLSKSYLLGKLVSLIYLKKKLTIRNSYQSKEFEEKFVSKTLNYGKIRNIFFNKNLFAYSNISEKEEIMKILNLNCSTEIKNYIDCAEKIIRNEFSIFEKNYNFKNEINWHYSFFQDYNWKLIKSEKINIRPKIKNLDVKYVWEFNRHNFLPYLGVAYYFTKNEKYAKKFKLIILDWIKKNPPLYGINWYSGLEISIRLISWIFALYFFKESKEINNNNFFRKIFCSMFLHAYFLRYFYTRHSFNHTIGDIFGVYLFSKIFEDIKPTKKWERLFFKKFKNQIHPQTRSDGTNIEQSVNYHRFVLEFFSLFVILYPNAISIEELHLIEKMYDYLLYIIKPNGTFPLIGDIDDGKVLPLTNNPFIDLINLGSILFNRGDLKYISKKISPISVLLLGSKGNHQFEKIQIQKPKDTNKFFKNAGYISLRNNWSKEGNYLFVDFGRFGPKNAPHSHSSITNLIFSYKGEDIIIDSGTYTYNKSWRERNLFRGSQAHNILTINKKNQAKISSWFAWENKPKIKREIRLLDNFIELVCFHDGYKGFIVKRTISAKKDLNTIVIRDSVFKTQNSYKDKFYNIVIYFHLKGDLIVGFENNSIILNNNLVFKVSSEHNFTMDIDKSFYSPKYGFKCENYVLKLNVKHSFENSKKIEIITKIFTKNYRNN